MLFLCIVYVNRNKVKGTVKKKKKEKKKKKKKKKLSWFSDFALLHQGKKMYEHNALGYWLGLALCLTKVRSSRARCPATALIFFFFFFF